MPHVPHAETSPRSVGISVAVCLLLLQISCASHVVSTRGTRGRIAVPPTFGRGLVARDRLEFESRPRVVTASEGREAPLSTTNIRVTQFDPLREEETTIAVDPNNPLHLLAGAITNSGGASYNQSYASLDGGLTWTQVPIPGQLNFLATSDPSVAYCGDGSAYFASLAWSGSGGSCRSGVIVDRSIDAGLTWPEENRSLLIDRTSDCQSITDKPWIACDATASSFSGRIYVEYGEPLHAGAPRRIKLKWSADHGATWSAPVLVSDADANIGALAIGPGGEVYVAMCSELSAAYLFDKSTDGGVTFGTDTAVAAVDLIDQDPLFIRSSLPSMAADRSNGPYRGNIYIAFSDKRYGDPDILLVRSTNGGAAWSAPIRVNDDPIGNGADQWAQGLTVDPLGRVIVTFYDRRRYAGTERYETWGAISRDGGQTFDTNFLIGDTPSDVPTTIFLGDYDSVAATSTKLYATWADQRPGLSDPPDIFTDAFPNTFAYDEVKGVVWTAASQMSFDTQDARFGVDLVYDVVGGLLGELRADRAFNRTSCTSPAWPAPPLADLRVPPAGDGYYYLVRARGPGGVGTYGDGSPARPNVRDPLDETISACP